MTGACQRWSVLVLLAVVAGSPLRAQERPRPFPHTERYEAKSDTARPIPADSGQYLQADTTARPVPDSLTHYFLPSLPGSLDRCMDSLDVVGAGAMEWISARTMNQILSSRPGVFGSDPSSVGQYFPLTIRGAGWRSYAVLVDGRPVADPASGTYNLSLFPQDMAERIEVVTGPRSFLYAMGGAGGTVNIVTHTASHRIPSTKIRYEEAAYNHAYSDGSFNQNLTRRSNLSFGYQYIGTDGRYLNSPHEQWNFRGALRYHLLPRVSVVLSDHYAQTQTGLNGGINYLKTGFTYSFEREFATVFSAATYEKLTRHDLDLRLVGIFLPDSTDLTTLAMYYSSNLREFRGGEITGAPSLLQDHRSSWFGVRAQQSASLGIHRLSGGFTAEVRQVEGSPALGRLKNPLWSAWAMDEVDITSDLRVAAYARSEIFRGEHVAGYGADVSVDLGGGLTFRGGGSLAQRAPTSPELFWSDSTLVRENGITTEKHRLLEGGVEWTSPDRGTLRLMVAHRTITNPILTMPYDGGSAPFPGVLLLNGHDRVSTLTAELSVQLRFFRYITIEGNGTYMFRQGAGVSTMDYPRFWGDGGIYLAGTFLSEQLDMKAGVHSRIATRHNGFLVSPPSLFTVPNTLTPLGMGSTLDLVAVAHISSAYVHVLWENVTNTEYFTSPFTPALDRALRFGISWEFLN